MDARTAITALTVLWSASHARPGIRGSRRWVGHRCSQGDRRARRDDQIVMIRWCQPEFLAITRRREVAYVRAMGSGPTCWATLVLWPVVLWPEFRPFFGSPQGVHPASRSKASLAKASLANGSFILSAGRAPQEPTIAAGARYRPSLSKMSANFQSHHTVLPQDR